MVFPGDFKVVFGKIFLEGCLTKIVGGPTYYYGFVDHFGYNNIQSNLIDMSTTDYKFYNLVIMFCLPGFHHVSLLIVYYLNYKSIFFNPFYNPG